jgi:hypothetical protein
MQLPEARLQLESAARELSALRVARLSVRCGVAPNRLEHHHRAVTH